MDKLLLVSFVVLFVIEGRNARNISFFLPHEQILVDNVTRMINPEARPVLNPDSPIVVKVGIALKQIIDLDEKAQVFKTMVYVRLYWTLEHISWDPNDYGGVQSIVLPPSKIWTPDLIVYNFASAEPTHEHKFNVQLYWDGSATWLFPVLMSTTCKVDITDFPYDQQKCFLEFGSWSYDGARLDVMNRSASGDMSRFVESGEWEVEGVPVEKKVIYYKCCPEPYPSLVYTVIMRRRSLFYVFNLLLPCVIITAITVVGFYLPPASGEKVSLSITILLSLTVFLLLVAESMPPSSESIPLIGWIFIIAIILAASSSAITVLVLGAYHRGTHGRKVPGWLKKLTYCLAVIVGKRHLVKTYGFWISERISDIDEARRRASTLSIKGSFHETKSGGKMRFHTKTNTTNTEGFDRTQLNEIVENTQKLLMIIQLNQASDSLEEEWHLVALILDRFFFVLFMIASLTLGGMVFGYRPYQIHGVS